jgi:outer membrane murein-binding lipoprotein Lpp
VKKIICFLLGLVLILPLAVSCSAGVSQDKYDKAASDLAAAKMQLAKIQADMTAKDQAVQTAADKLTKAKLEIDILSSILLPAMSGELGGMTDNEAADFFLSMRDKVNTVGDAQLTAKLDAIINASNSENATMEFFIYLFHDISKTLQ